MLNTVFYSVLNMSITAGVIGLIVIVIRKLRLIPSIGVYCLWFLVLIKLLIPFSISSRLSLLNLAGSFVKRVVTLPVAKESNLSLSMSNTIGAAETYFPVTYKSDLLSSIFGVASGVWFAGMLLAIAFTLVIYYLTNRQLGKLIHFKDNIYSCTRVDTPCVKGILKQRILVPEEYLNDSRFKYIVMHEMVHINRRDNLLRFLAILTACIHWFNPLVWIFLKLFLDDMEIICDISAVKKLSADDRKNYAGALLSVGTEERSSPLSAAFGKSGIKARVINVLNYKKISLFALVVMLLFLAAAAAALMTNPVR